MKNINNLITYHKEESKKEDMARRERQLEIINIYSSYGIKQIDLLENCNVSKPILNKYFRGDKVKDSTEIEILKSMQLLIDLQGVN